MFNSKVSFAMPVRILVLAAFIVAAVQFPALAGRQDFVFVNNSGKVVTELRFSPSQNSSFEGNVLSSPIYHGESRTIRVNGYSDADRYWDFKVVYGIDLLSVGRITVDGAGTAHY